MRILVLGIGLQGKAVLYDLARSPEVQHVISADADLAALERYVQGLRSDKIEPVGLDAQDEAAIAGLLERVDAVTLLLPNAYNLAITRLAVARGVHSVNTSYPPAGMDALGEEAARGGVAILPEFGFDPGIDLVLAGQAVRDLDEVHLFNSYGTGFPEPAAATNPLHYKISWSFAGVLRAYVRDARMVHNGQVVRVPGNEIFSPQNVHSIDLGAWGTMEAYPNGDVLPYLDRLSIRATVREAGRYSTRYPGHSAFWYIMAQMGFLDDQPIIVNGVPIAPREFVLARLEPQLQFAPGERDVAALRVEVAGLKDGQPRRIIYEVIDQRDLDTGLLAMNRLVGFPASIGAQMILRGDITKRGLLSPLTDVPAKTFIAALQERGILIVRKDEPFE